MKISRGFVKTAFVVIEKATGKRYDCFIQDYEYILSGKHETRFNIGINGWTEWGFLYYLDEEEFNEKFIIA